MEAARSVLADLLGRVESPSADAHLRLQAAAMANRLALFHGDPSLTDVAESLALDVDDHADHDVATAIRREASVARATRRAIALAHHHKLQDPRVLALSLVGNADVLLDEVRRQLRAGKNSLARATLEVARTRHPDHQGLVDLEQSLQDETRPI